MSRTDLRHARPDADLQRIVDDLARQLEAGDAPIRTCWVVDRLTRPRSESHAAARETSTVETVASVGRAIPKVAAWIWPRRQLIWSELRAVGGRDRDREQQTGEVQPQLFAHLDRALERAAEQLTSL